MGKLTEAIQQKTGRDEENMDLFPTKEALLTEDTKRLNCDVPSSIYKKFQIRTIENDSSITETINQLILEYLARHS